ncbi:hypothetical protein QJS10_CPB22g00895 [Acorus calamus]|uniref:Uncharacterized protein n=1 Tax=Acorus calamus TaxID=4465 RepID=A0AAV9C447_ACOCL|nr:hypothetical protein QJS10_CPB22g00895 [Acorus calamus]
MEAINEQSPLPAVSSAKSKLRYPLRSAGKPKEDKSEVRLVSSSMRRGRPAPSLSRSVNVLDLSGKNKPVKPPRRLSVPSKAAASTSLNPVGSITPISEIRTKKPLNAGGKSETPLSDISRSSNRKKICALSSVSYWLTQIKLSESASKHSISLGFFKLALESGCEPLQRICEELKSYACRYKLLELGEPVKELLQSYNILEEMEHLKVSESSHGSEEDSFSSPTLKTGNLKPKSLDSDISLSKKDGGRTRTPMPRPRASFNGNPVSSRLVAGASGNAHKKLQKTNKVDPKKEAEKVKGHLKKSSVKEVEKSMVEEKIPQEDKENVDTQIIEGNAIDIQA